jgi:hypothetical protein
MVDANGNLIGYVVDDLTEAPGGIGGPKAQALVMNINGVEFAVAATASGFPVTSNNGLLEVYYDGANCTGNAYLPAPWIDSPQTPGGNPLVTDAIQGSGRNVWSLQTGFIFDSTIYYPQQPYSTVLAQSEIEVFGASIENGVVTGNCANGSNGGLEVYGDPMISVGFPNFTPPFTTEPIPQN